MPIKKSAIKEKRVAERRRIVNLRTVRSMREGIKKFKKGDESVSFSTMQKVIDKACKRGIIKKNRASRMKSRLASFFTTKES